MGLGTFLAGISVETLWISSTTLLMNGTYNANEDGSKAQSSPLPYQFVLFVGIGFHFALGRIPHPHNGHKHLCQGILLVGNRIDYQHPYASLDY